MKNASLATLGIFPVAKEAPSSAHAFGGKQILIVEKDNDVEAGFELLNAIITKAKVDNLPEECPRIASYTDKSFMEALEGSGWQVEQQEQLGADPIFGGRTKGTYLLSKSRGSKTARMQVIRAEVDNGTRGFTAGFINHSFKNIGLYTGKHMVAIMVQSARHSDAVLIRNRICDD